VSGVSRGFFHFPPKPRAGGGRDSLVFLLVLCDSLKCKFCISREGFRHGNRTSVGKSAHPSVHKDMKLIDYEGEGGVAVCEPAPESPRWRTRSIKWDCPSVP
jgi:hypothetical protein